MAERTSPNMALVALTAGITGAALGLLFAPRSGSETRRKIHERADELKDQAETGLHDIKDSLNSNVNRARNRFSSALQSASKRTKEDEYEDLESLKNHSTTKQSPVLNAWEEEV